MEAERLEAQFAANTAGPCPSVRVRFSERDKLAVLCLSLWNEVANALFLRTSLHLRQTVFAGNLSKGFAML